MLVFDKTKRKNALFILKHIFDSKTEKTDKRNDSIKQFFDWECFVRDKMKSNKININKKNLCLTTEFNKYQNKIIKKINRKEIGLDKLKQSLKEVIAFKLIKIEELLHNYVDYYIKDKQLYLVLDFIDLVNKYLFFIDLN